MLHCPFCEAELTLARVPATGTAPVFCEACFNPSIVDARPAGPVISPVPGVMDSRMVAKPDSLAAALFDAVRQSIDDMPLLPEISRRVLLLLRDPEISMRAVGEVVGEDPVVAAKVLRVANSAMYGGLSEISELGAACARLGMTTVANVVQTAANGQLYITSNKEFKAQMERLQRHSVVTAHCASEIARSIADPRADVAFAAALLHRIGAIPVIDAVTSARKEPLSRLRENTGLLNEMLAAYSPLMGLMVVQRWNLPTDIMAATYFSALPDAEPSPDGAVLAHTIALASAIASASGFPALEHMEESMLMAHPSSQFLGLGDVKIATIRVDLEDRVAPLLDAAA